MQWYIIPLTLLALFAVFTYFRGMKKNKWISGFIAQETESVLEPLDTEYVNIGGAIGYNFTYKLKEPFTSAKGTFVLMPRQSAFYMPIIVLSGRKDRYYLTLYTKQKLLGEGHIIEKRYYSFIARTITGHDSLQQCTIQKNNKTFILLWNTPRLKEKLEALLNSCEHAELLKHFCVYKDNSNFYIYSEPKRFAVEKLLASIYKNLSLFW